MQRPTLQNVRIRSTRDALQVFHGVATSLLPLITRRLDAEERRAIVAGNVYVWEERGANTEPTGLGMERWTDGMGWGPSRVRDEFLFYHQKESDVSDDPINPVTPWAQMMRKREQPSSRVYSSSSSRHTGEVERLIKQTYSVHVSLPMDRARGIVRKWHLTAYFSQQKLDGLDTIDNIRGVGDMTVPHGWFRSARAAKSRRDGNNVLCNSQPSEALIAASAPPNSKYVHHSFSSSQHRESSSSDRHSSASPAPSDHSSTTSSSSTPSLSSGSHFSLATPSQLVPLEYLQSISCPRRHPIDEQLLRRFSAQALAPATFIHAGRPAF